MEGKEIKQTGIVNRNIEVKVVRGKTIINQSSKFDFDTIVVKPEHLKELSLAICPELQSELEKANKEKAEATSLLLNSVSKQQYIEVLNELEKTKEVLASLSKLVKDAGHELWLEHSGATAS